MTRVRVGSLLVLVTVIGLAPFAANAQDALPGEPAADKQTVGELLFNIRHYLQLPDHPTAVIYLKALKARNADPAVLLKTVHEDAVLGHSKIGLEVLIVRPEVFKDAELRALTTWLRDTLLSGRVRLNHDPAEIARQIKNLKDAPGRGQDAALDALRVMAPWSVAQMVAVLTDDHMAAYRPVVITALPQMGRAAVEPLCAALSMSGPNNAPTKVDIVRALGAIGYPHAIPYIAAAEEQTQSPDLKAACKSAITALSNSPRATFSGSAAQMFFQLGDAYYSEQASLKLPGDDPELPVWDWNAKVGVASQPCSRSAYLAVMAMQSFARALQLDARQPEAVSLWIASNIRKEGLLPKDGKDPTRKPGDPDARYYAVVGGPSALLRGLARAVRDKDGLVALGLAKALNDVGFAASADNEVSVLASALNFPDRRVQSEVALVIAGANLKTRVPGIDMTIPILGRAMAQTGDKYAVALLPAGADTDKLAAQVKAAGYRLDVLNSRQSVLDQAARPDVPHVDVLLVGFDATDGGLAGLAELRKNLVLRQAVPLLVSNSVETVQKVLGDAASIGVVQFSSQATEVNDAIVKVAGRSDTGLTPEEATDYALRAAAALRDVALAGTPSLDCTLAVPALIHTLVDTRADVAVAAADALSYVNDERGQRALAQGGLDAKADPARRVAMLKSLAVSAKRFGNKVTEEQVDAVQKAVMEEPEPTVRAAAAQAMGALNLPIKMDKMIVKTLSN